MDQIDDSNKLCTDHLLGYDEADRRLSEECQVPANEHDVARLAPRQILEALLDGYDSKI